MNGYIYNNNVFTGPPWAFSHLVNGSSQKVYLELTRRYNISRSQIYLDCGSAYGSEAIPFHDLFDEIYCFEALKRNYLILNDNIEPYKNIKAYRLALNRYNGKTVFISYEGKDTIGNIKSVGFRDNSRPMHYTLVQCFTLDSFKFKNVGFIKIDVEGAEKQVLLGAKETLKNNAPLIRIEITNNHEEVLDFLLGLKYNPIAFDCAGSIYDLDESFKFNTISNGDVFWTCNNVIVAKDDLLKFKDPMNAMRFPYYPYGMNPCQGDFWFYKT